MGELKPELKNQKTKQYTINQKQMIFDLLLSLNKGNSGCIDDRVLNAIRQLEQLQDYGVVN